MAQTTPLSIPDSNGAAFLSDVNAKNAALFSSNSGPTAPSPTVAGMLWFDNGVSPAVLRQRNASNTAWNRLIDTADLEASRAALGATATGSALFTAADVAAARSALNAMVQPNPSAGLGQIAGVYADQNTNFVAPAGGTWWGRYQRRNKTTLGNNGQGTGLYGGGTTILACANNEDCFGDFIRIA